MRENCCASVLLNFPGILENSISTFYFSVNFKKEKETFLAGNVLALPGFTRQLI